jgi:hypothetical protein
MWGGAPAGHRRAKNAPANCPGTRLPEAVILRRSRRILVISLRVNSARSPGIGSKRLFSTGRAHCRDPSPARRDQDDSVGSPRPKRQPAVAGPHSRASSAIPPRRIRRTRKPGVCACRAAEGFLAARATGTSRTPGIPPGTPSSAGVEYGGPELGPGHPSQRGAT